jgi:hypothetical protein
MKSPATCQPLNCLDQMVLVCHQVMRDCGGAGFTHQMQVWLQGRLDVTLVRTVLEQIHARYPVLTARLEESRQGTCWRFRSGATLPLHETSLPSAQEEEVLAHTAALLSRPLDLDQVDPVQIHVLHLPDGRDLFVMQYAHALMDMTGADLLLQEITALGAGQELAEPVREPDPVQTYLKRFSFWQRLRAAWGLRPLGRALHRLRRIYLCDPREPVPGGTLRILVRTLDEKQTEAVMAGTARHAGFPSPVTALLASSFRALGRHNPHPLGDRDHFIALLATNMRPRQARGPIFANYWSTIPLIAAPRDVEDRNALVSLLNRQMRDQVRRAGDLGVLAVVNLIMRWGYGWRRRLRNRRRNNVYEESLMYAYVGNLVARGATFCGVPIERQVPLVQTVSPPALCVSGSLSCGKLQFVVGHLQETIPPSRAEAFLDALIKDLTCS